MDIPCKECSSLDSMKFSNISMLIWWARLVRFFKHFGELRHVIMSNEIWLQILQEKAFLYRTTLYLAASASAEFFADIALCPMEAVKVRIQTQPGFAGTLREGLPKFIKEEGVMG